MGVVEDVKEEIKEELVEKNNDRGVLDIVAEKAVSRKLLVWVVASIFLCLGKISADEWAGISLGYVGVEGFADLAAKWKSAGKTNGQ